MFDQRYERIPGLDAIEPGPILGTLLSAIDIDQVSPHDRVIVLRAHQRMESHHQAHRYQAMTSIADALEEDDPHYRYDAAAAEIQCALNLTRRATESELSFALELQRRLPRVWEALMAGLIDLRRAKTFSYATSHLTDTVTRTVVERVIDDAAGLTSGELKAKLGRAAIEADPDSAQDRYQSVVKERRLIAEPTPDGTGNLLGLDLPLHRVAAASRNVNHLARSLRTKDETRTMDQLRADVYLDLLTGTNSKAKGNANGGVHISGTLDMLTGASNDPGELNGWGPVIADIARQVTKQQTDTEWRWAITNDDGQILNDGTTQRRPNTGLRRSIQARDTTCVFPGCRMPAVDCDIDHTTRWTDGGKTSKDNGAPLCRHNHITKDQHGWTYHRLPNGDYQWTSRLGHTYTGRGRSP